VNLEPENMKEIEWPSSKGDLRIRAFCSPENIRQYNFDSQFGTHAHYKSLYTKRESLEKNAEDPDANVVLAVENSINIIGFGVFAKPDPDERWNDLGPGVMMEINALEVCRDWRSAKIAPGIITMMLSHPRIEDMIAYFVGYSWTWDLDGNKMTAQEYHQMMIRLFEPFGFIEYQTNEPNICLKPENVFMGRVGANISAEMQQKFKWLRFGITQ